MTHSDFWAEISSRHARYQVKLDGEELGEISSFVGVGFAIVSLSDLSSALKLRFELDNDHKNLIIKNHSFENLASLKLKEKTYSSSSRSGSWYDQELVIRDDEIFMGVNFLNRLLDLHVTLDRSQHVLVVRNLEEIYPDGLPEDEPEPEIPPDVRAGSAEEVTSKESLAQTESDTPLAPKNDPEKEWLVFPNRSPDAVEDYIIQPAAPVTLVESKPVTPPEPSTTTEALPPSQDEETEESKDNISLAEGDEQQSADTTKNTEETEDEIVEFEDEEEAESLILQPTIVNAIESDTFLEAYRKGNRLYVTFADLMEFLEFYITLQEDGMRAEGWFISAQNKFLMNRDEKFVEAGEKRFEILPNETLWQDDLLFVDTKAIEKWLPITLTLKEEWMQLLIASDEELPFQLRARRQKQWIQLKHAREKETLKLEPVPSEHELFSLPFVDITLDSFYDPKAANSFANTYTVQATGDVGYHTVNSFINGSNSEAIQSARFTALRKDNEGNLLGPLGATEYHFGDIDAPNLPLIAQINVGRGFKLTNRPFDHLPEADVKNFVGNAQPGWEVELYRNGVLQEFQLVSEEGRYNFEDIPVLFGKNEFTLIFYGPQGQIEERKEQVQIGDSILRPGEFHYTAAISEKGRTVTNLGNVQTVNGQGMRVTGSVDYGLAENFSVGGFLAYLPLQDGTSRSYTGLTVDTLFEGFLLNADAAMDVEGTGSAFRFSALGAVEDWNLRFTQELNNELVSELQVNPSGIRKSRSLIGVNSQLYLPLIEDIGFNLTTQFDRYANDREDWLTNLRIAKPIFGLGTTHQLTYQHMLNRFLNYTIAAQGRLNNIFWRLSGSVELIRDSQWQDLGLSMQYRLNDSMTARSEIKADFRNGTNGFLGQNITLHRDDFRISASAQADDEGNYAVGINLGLSFGFQPNGDLHWQANNMTSGGAVLGNVFLDENYNGIHDLEEEMLTDVGIRVNGLSNRHAADNKHLAAPLTGYESVSITLDESSIENPLWRSSVSGYEVVPLPGQFVSLDFPIVSTSEIDGQVSLRVTEVKKNAPDIIGPQLPLEHKQPIEEMLTYYDSALGNMIVQLVNQEGDVVNDVLSEFDGFYLIDRVLPGLYTLRIEPSQLKEMNLVQIETPEILVEQESDFYIDQHIIVEAKKIELPDRSPPPNEE